MDATEDESLFEQFFQASPDLLGFIDRNGHFLKINPVWTQKTGFDVSELMGRFFYDHIPEEDRVEAVRLFENFRSAARLGSFKSHYQRKDGTKLYLEWQCISLDPMSPIFLMAYDMTSLMKSEKALSESKENYRLLADCVSEGVVLSENDIIIEANKAFGRMAWMEPEEVLGKNISLLVPPDHRKRLLDDMLEGTEEGYELTGIRKNGTVYPLEVRTYFIDHQGRKIRVNLLRDIQDKKKLLELSKEEGTRALQAQEKVFAALTANTRELIAIIDGEGRLKYSGGGNEGVLGYGLGENIGRSLFELIHPEDVERQRKKFADLLHKPGTTETAYFRLKHKNGKWHHVEVTAHNLLEEPIVRGVVCNVRDISDRIHAQKRLMESERFHRALFENALDVVFIQEPDGLLRYISPSVRTVLGLEPSDLIDQNVFTYLHPDDQWEAIEQIKKLVSGESPRVTFEQRMRHQNGTWRNAEWICQNLLHDPVVEGIVVNLRDVTDRKRAETALKNSEARLRGVFNSTSQVFELMDLNGKLVAFNEVARETHKKLFGQALQLGGYMNEYMPSGFKDRLPGFLLEAQKDEIHHREVPINDVEGQEHWFDITTNPVRDDAGSLVGVCLAATSVDERRSSQEKFLHVERLAAVGQVTNAIAHEMRNPLSVILALSKEKAETGDEDAGRIVRQAVRLSRLMEDIMDFSRRSVLKKEQLSVIALLQTSIATARKQVGKAADGVTLRWEGITDDTIWGDRVRLTQLFHNLLLNAFQALSGQGQLTLSCRREGDMMALTVEDDGPGATPEELIHFFEPFFTTKKLGTGLGLAISRKIVEDHGGALEAKTKQPHGMVLKTTLPAYAAIQAESTTSSTV